MSKIMFIFRDFFFKNKKSYLSNFVEVKDKKSKCP